MATAVRRGRRFGRRLWPGTFAGRLTLLLVLGFVLIQAAGLVVFLDERREFARGLESRAPADQLAAVVALMDRAPPDQRRLLRRAIASRTLAVELHSARPSRSLEAGPDPALEPFAAALREVAPGELEIGLAPGWGRGSDHEPRLLPSPQRIVVLARLADGTWLELTAPLRLGPPWRPFRLLAWLGVVAVAVLVVGRLAARRFARPLEALAAAADRVGVDAGAAPLAEAGPSELRRAASAFNRMQARITRLVADRTLMLAAVAHDLRSALTRLRLRVELIEEEAQRARAVADLEAMQQMLDETLAFARDEAADEGREPIDLAALLQTLVSDVSDAGGQAVYEGPDRLTALVRPVGIRRALANLIDNAVRYGGRAEVRLQADRRQIEIRIDDRGPGIPPERRDDVFRPFFRLEPSRSRTTGGSGLGLAVAQSIVRRHGGEIGLEDRRGGGLRVRVGLPL